MTRTTGKELSFSASGATSSIYLPPGRWLIHLICGGSTIEIRGKAKDSTSAFVAMQIPLVDGTFATSTSDNDIIECPGGLEYEINVTSYVGAGKAIFIASRV